MRRIRYSVRDCEHNPKHEWNQSNECLRMKLESDAASRKRTKEVYNTGEIPHLWAHKVQPSARNAQGNLKFYDGVIYSYGSHFPIAAHVEHKGKMAVLFTTRSYSVTTSGHIQAVRCAIPDSLPVFHTNDVPQRPIQDKDSIDHASNLAQYKTDMDASLVKATRARSSSNKEWNHGQAVNSRNEYNAYLKFFGLRNKPLPEVPALDSKLMDAIKAKESKRIKQETAKRKAEQAARLLKMAGEIGEWRGGSLRSISLPYDAPVMLRIAGDTVETSKGAIAPLAHAKRALVLIRAVVARGENWHTNGHTCHVGHYKIDSISADGTVKAGCHTIPRAEWEALAPKLDAIPASPEVESNEEAAQ